MGWDYDASDMPESFDGYANAPAGDYHFAVTGVEVDGGKNGEMVVDMEVLAGNPADQEGKTHREYFSKPKQEQDAQKRQATIKRALAFAIAVGLTTEDELLESKKAGKPLIPDFTLAVGRQFCGRLSSSEYNGKTSQKLGYDMWAIDSPKAAGIPLNQGMLTKNGDAAANDPFGEVPFD